MDKILKHNIIFLIGFMGSGKSTIGPALAKSLGFYFIDLDDYIESKEKMIVSDIFKKKGETYFRNLETIALQEICSLSMVVIGLGGGTPCFNNNIDVINSSGKSIYLQMSSKALASRLFTERNKRPIIAHISNLEMLQEFIENSLRTRSPFYTKADLIIDGNKTIENLVNKIKEDLFID